MKTARDQAPQTVATRETQVCIQPFGAVLGVVTDSLEVRFVSANAHSVLGIHPEAALNRELVDLFDRETTHGLINVIAASGGQSRLVSLTASGAETRWLSVHGQDCDDMCMLQFEPARPDQESLLPGLETLDVMTSALMDVHDLDRFALTVTRLLRRMTGFDRALFCDLCADHKSVRVWAEDKAPGFLALMDQRLGGAPTNTKAVRHIADTQAETVPLMCTPDITRTPDLASLNLRMVDVAENQLMEALQTRALLALPISGVDGTQHWVLCAHETARPVNPEMRAMAQTFGRIVTARMAELHHASHLGWTRQSEEVRRNLTARIEPDRANKPFDADLLSELTIVFRCQGMAYLTEDEVRHVGATPDVAALNKLFSATLSSEDLFVSDQVRADLPELTRQWDSQLCGLVVISTETARLAGFRKAMPEAALANEDANSQAKPGVGKSEPWSKETIVLMREVRTLVMAAEMQRVSMRTERRQKLLINELNHRVRNMLAMIRSLSHQGTDQFQSIDDYVDVLTSRIAAVANTHELIVSQPGTDVSVAQIVQMEAAPHNNAENRVVLRGSDSGIRQELAAAFAMVIHELMTNALKYGALAKPDGSVFVDLTNSSAGLSLTWTERGGPAVSGPDKRGFGSTLIENTVRYELNGGLAMDFQPGGLVVSLDLPIQVLSSLGALRKAAEPQQSKTIQPAPVKVDKNAICLLVEDNFLVSMDTSRILHDLGFEVETATSAADALDKAERLSIGFALLDINLGGGQTSTKAAIELMRRRVPFVFVTGYGEDATLPNMFKDVPILKKPLRKEDFLEAVAAFPPATEKA